MADDVFNRADGPLGADWETVDGSGGAVSGNRAIGTDAGDYSASRYNAVEFNDTQTSRAFKMDANNYVAVGVRMTTGANYYAFFSHGSLQKLVSGANTEIANVGNTVAEGQALSLEVNGTSLEPFIADISEGVTSDATHSSGKPGVAWFDNVAKLDTWNATGDVVGGGGGGGSIVFNLQIG